MIKPLKRINGNNKHINRILDRLTVADRDDIGTIERRLSRKKEPLKSENVIIVTDSPNVKRFRKFRNSFITALDPSDLKKDSEFDPESFYCPYLETVFFAVMRTLGHEAAHIRKWYRQIPNIENVGSASLRKMCFRADGKTPKRVVTLKLKPISKHDPDDLREIYERIETFIRNA